MFKGPSLYKHFIVTAAVFILSCENQRAKNFLHKIDLQERASAAIIAGENGTESQKLEHMISNNFDSALLVNEKQQAEFDEIIQQIESLSTTDLEDGKILKMESVQYYQALKNLYGYAKWEIQQQKRVREARGKDQLKAQDSLISLTKRKKQLFQEVYHHDSLFNSEKERFAKRHKLSP